ncbi:MAG: bifunctional (p)ppGpp synthetase/guanosine-3',5'-bis(diphosphate) 3'-pyrophosphohydrolase [Cyclobacteriaceae bacterium]
MVVAEIGEENKEIVKRYRKLLRHAKPLLKDGDARLIRKAFNTSLEAHQDMRRKSGEPYILHPLAVAQICVEEIGLGTTSIISALLHDTVEDTEIELEDIERDFGPKVTRIIDGLTKISGVFEYGSSQQAENFRKMLLTLSEDVRVILIKLADRLHNMRTLDSMPRNKQLKISSETLYIYAPLAHRLGLYAIKTELEDLHLKYSESDVYKEIISKIDETQDPRKKFVRNFIGPIQKALKDAGFDVEIKGRMKSIFSIWSKMQKQNVSFEEVYDLFAIRIIIKTRPEKEKAVCWQVYSIVTDFYQPNPDRLRDWISTPKANGYESLHTTVMSDTGKWVEVQIRSRRMDDIAEKGYAAHWKYKDNTPTANESGLEEWIKRVRDTLEQNDSNAIEFLDDFRGNFFNEEVFAFTPKGDLKTLPNGATALDFAFDIHTEVGARCIGAKVNQRLVSLSHKLKNGDQVEVLTSSKQKPSEDWLRFVVSSKAKSKIKDYLKGEKKQYAIDGKEIVKRKLKQLKISLNSLVIEQLTEFFNEKTPLDLFYQIGKGKINHSEIKKFKDYRHERSKKPKTAISDTKSLKKQLVEKKGKDKDTDMLLIGEDMDVVDYTLAKCCNPIAGDEVFGFVTVSEGIKIHRTTCPNAIELMSNYGYRVVKAKWTSQQEIAFLAGLRIEGTDRIGMINDITTVISGELKVNMRSFTIDTDDGIFRGNIKLYVNDTIHLKTLMQKLANIDDVVAVSRFDN